MAIRSAVGTASSAGGGLLFRNATDLSATAFTVCMRVYPINLTEGSVYGVMVVRPGGNSPLMEFFAPSGSGFPSSFLSRGSSTDDIPGSLTPVANTWCHTAWARGAGSDLLYLDGALALSTTATGYVAGTELAIGQYSGGSGALDGYGLSGRYMAVKVWNATLTQAEIQAEMDTIAPRRRQDLWAWYPMLSDASRNKDFSGNARDLTESGTLTNEAEDTTRWGTRRSHFLPAYVPSGGGGPSPILGDSSATLPLGGTAAGVVPIDAVSSKGLSLGGSATGTVPIAATSSQGLPLTGSSAAGVLVQAASSQALPLAGSSAAAVLVQAATAQPLPLSGSATGTIPVLGASAQPLPLAGAAAVLVSIFGASSQPLPLGGSSASTVLVQASSLQPLPFGGTARVSSDITGSSSVSLPLTGSAAGVVFIDASSSRSLSLAGIAAATVLVTSQSSSPLPLSGIAAAFALIQAQSIGGLRLGGFAAGTVFTPGAATWLIAGPLRPASPRAIVRASVARAVITPATPLATVTHSAARAIITPIEDIS